MAPAPTIMEACLYSFLAQQNFPSPQQPGFPSPVNSPQGMFNPNILWHKLASQVMGSPSAFRGFKEKMILKDLETADKTLKKEPEDTPPGSNDPAPPPLHVQIPNARGLAGPAALGSPYGSPLGASLLPPSSTGLPHALGFQLNGDLQAQLHGLDYSSPAAAVAAAAAVVAASQRSQLTPTSSQHDLSQQSTPTGSSSFSSLILPGDIHGIKQNMSELAASNAFNHDWQNPLLSGYNSSPSPVGSSRSGLNAAGGLCGGDDESSRKRQVRLLKNREAAKECRRKKKEYVKCLENRVAVLENQNKALIEELKTLKELYCRKEKAEL